VEAIAVHTTGLGGDSEVHRDAAKHLTLGPHRAVPISLLATQHPGIVPILETQLARPVFKPLDGLFALRLRALPDDGASLGSSQRQLWDRLAAGPCSLEELIEREHLDLPLRRLVARGLVARAAFTPSDAAHVLGLQDTWSTPAARLAASLRARWEALAGKGDVPAAPEPFAAAVLELATRRTALALLAAALAEDGLPAEQAAAGLAAALLDRAVEGTTDPTRLVRPNLALGLPVVAIGAPARLVYPEACRRLATRLVVPPFAHVSNAVGAVAGDVVQSATVLVTAPDESRFRVHLEGGPTDLATLDAALALAESAAASAARARAEAAGADEIDLRTTKDLRVVEEVEGRPMFVQATFTSTATGRPRLGG
jgi:N-methylhydantoinase A/oxoprolinase/acetone carboxylase beta subunit